MSDTNEPDAYGLLDEGEVHYATPFRDEAERVLRRTEDKDSVIVPLYRSPTLSDAERDALLDAAEVCDSRERRSIEFRLPQEAEHWRCLAATLRGLSERLSGTQEKSIREDCHK